MWTSAIRMTVFMSSTAILQQLELRLIQLSSGIIYSVPESHVLLIFFRFFIREFRILLLTSWQQENLPVTRLQQENLSSTTSYRRLVICSASTWPCQLLHGTLQTSARKELSRQPCSG